MTKRVSRETSDQLDVFAQELLRWTKKINLISRGDMADLRTRHIQDSVQVHEVAPPAKVWLDLGTGGGLPAIPVAILRRVQPVEMTMLESDARKCAFLRHITRMLDLSGKVVTARIEDQPPVGADLISARALADLSRLLSLALPHALPSTTFVFPKGEAWREEVDTARQTWHFDLDAVPSQTRPGAAILRIQNVRPI